jgi:leucyl-tRNA synthetase
MDFIQLFNFGNKNNDKAEDINFDFNFRKRGNATVNAVCDDKIAVLRQVNGMLLQKSNRRKFLQYRLTYLAETEVNWCPD